MAAVGGQPGNQNAAKARRWRDAILRAISRSAGELDLGLDKAADKLVALAQRGDKWAIDHMADRIDGKVAQAIIGGQEDEPPIRVEGIQLVPLVRSTDPAP